MTKIEMLNKRADEKKDNRNSFEYKKVSILLELGGKIIRTGYTSGSGKHSKAINKTSEVSRILSALKIKHECKNDATRGGVNGEYIILNRKYTGKNDSGIKVIY